MKVDLTKLPMPQLIVANGVAYLGQVKEGDTISVEYGMALGSPADINSTHLDAYIVAAFSGKLSNTKIGNNSAWQANELDEDLTVSWNISKLKMDQAIAKSPIDAVVATFNSLKV